MCVFIANPIRLIRDSNVNVHTPQREAEMNFYPSFGSWFGFRRHISTDRERKGKKLQIHIILRRSFLRSDRPIKDETTGKRRFLSENWTLVQSESDISLSLNQRVFSGRRRGTIYYYSQFSPKYKRINNRRNTCPGSRPICFVYFGHFSYNVRDTRS